MTKRTYIIIIALLVALDVATGFWYIVNHINTDGKSDLFDCRCRHHCRHLRARQV